MMRMRIRGETADGLFDGETDKMARRAVSAAQAIPLMGGRGSSMVNHLVPYGYLNLTSAWLGRQNQPENPEAILDHAEPRREESLAQGHVDLPPLGQSREDAIRFRDAGHIQGQAHALENGLAGAAAVGEHDIGVTDLQARVHNLVAGPRRDRARRMRIGTLAETHLHVEASAQSPAVEFQGLFALAIEKEVGLNVHEASQSGFGVSRQPGANPRPKGCLEPRTPRAIFGRAVPCWKEMSSLARNVILHQGALGDWVLTLPIVRALSLASGRTEVVAAGQKGRLAQRLFPQIVARDIGLSPWTSLFGEMRDEHAESQLAAVLGTTERVIDFVGSDTDVVGRNIERLAPNASVHHVQPRPPEDWSGHIGAWHLAQLRQQGWDLAPRPPSRRSNPRGALVVHPGSGGRHKCWPPERFAALIDDLRKRQPELPVLPVLGEAELERWPPEARKLWQGVYGARVLGTLDELYDVLTQARVYVGNDSGPTHLAAQLGLPTLALFGPSPAQVWSPVGPGVRVIAPARPVAMDWLSVDRVIRELLGILEAAFAQAGG